MKKNDFRYIHSEDIHSLSSKDSGNIVLILSVNIEYLEKIFPNIRTAVITMPTDKTLLLYNNQQLQLKYCIFVLLDEFLKRTDGFHSRVKKTLKTIFGIIYREFRGFTVDKENKAFVYKRLQDMRQTERLGEIIDDIYTNYVEPSTLEEIASRQNLNPYYLSHLFSQTIGINYRDFINMVRVETSEYDLLTSDLSISHIVLSSGFSMIVNIVSPVLFILYVGLAFAFLKIRKKYPVEERTVWYAKGGKALKAYVIGGMFLIGFIGIMVNGLEFFTFSFLITVSGLVAYVAFKRLYGGLYKVSTGC